MKKPLVFFVLFFGLGIGLFAARTGAAASTADGKGLLPLGAEAPDFHLRDVVSGKMVSRDGFAGKKALLVIFICRHCPYVQNMKTGLEKLAEDYVDKDIAIVAISANDPAGLPQDAPASLREMAQEEGFEFPFLYDETQEVAKAYTAICTPDPFLFDQRRRLVYRGQFDDSRPHNGKPVTGKDLRAAINAVLADSPVNQNQAPSTGCSIKWKPGNEPAYTQ